MQAIDILLQTKLQVNLKMTPINLSIIQFLASDIRRSKCIVAKSIKQYCSGWKPHDPL